MRVEVSQLIHKPVADVWRFYAVDHVRNHPRWDPNMELEQITDGPIDVGTVIRRRNTHFGDPVEGSMEVVEFEPERAMGVVIRDGPSEARGRVTFEAKAEDSTIITLAADMPGLEAPVDEVRAMIERSARNIRDLVESEG